MTSKEQRRRWRSMLVAADIDRGTSKTVSAPTSMHAMQRDEAG